MPYYIQEHGTAIDKHKTRVKCNYCAKVVAGFNRLEHHLGGVRGDVVPCEQVPSDVKALVRDDLLERKTQRLIKEVGQLQHPDLALKRNFSAMSAKLQTTPPTAGKGKKAMFSMPKDSSVPCVAINAQNTIDSKLEDSLRNAYRCIGRFFYDAGIDFGAARSPYFEQMLATTAGCGIGFEVPSYHELRGWILQEELEYIREHVGAVEHSWGRTGCSILLDGWTDEKGRNLINFLVDCPQGVIFLRSVDASDLMGNVDALCSLLDEVIQEVGVDNVVQVISYNASHFMVNVGKRLMAKHRTIFWTVCAVHCLELMLDEIAKLGNVMEVLDKAKKLTRFIYGSSSILELMKKHASGRDLVKCSKMRSAMPFLTLESIVSEKENLQSMFSSHLWNASVWASSSEGKRIAELVQEPSFWTGAEEALKATVPLVCVLRLIDRGDKPLMGYIYETMDQAKETIKENFKNNKSKYMRFWKIIDVIWDNNLHSHLHAAGYYLNPSLFYSSDFCADAEVTNGLLCCILRMVKNQHVNDLIALQLEVYRAALGGFSQESAIEHRTNTPPALWWSLYGEHCPELQQLAIRILSQTGGGVVRYDLKRRISEQLHTKGRNATEQQILVDLEFVHYNLRLKHPPMVVDDEKDNIVLDEIDPMDDWVVKAQERDFISEDLGWMDAGGNNVKNVEEVAVMKGSPSVGMKEELL